MMDYDEEGGMEDEDLDLDWDGSALAGCSRSRACVLGIVLVGFRARSFVGLQVWYFRVICICFQGMSLIAKSASNS